MPGVIANRIDKVLGRISSAAIRSGRDPGQITLIAVSKTVSVETLREAVEAGVTNLGENRVQEAVEKMDALTAPGLTWHLIGHLQSNKARVAASRFDVIHTVDSPRLADRLDRACRELGRRIRVLIQVDLGREPTKAGIPEEGLLDLTHQCDGSQNLMLAGLMTLPPYFEGQEQVRPYFSRLRELLDVLNHDRPKDKRLSELSMGMSHDLEVAVEEGATMVRIGTAIFGSRG
jgi:pyridoxal phosphate enzyme (YggS family)